VVVRRAYPVRTCVGCRERAPATELLRVVAEPVAVTEANAAEVIVVVPDPTRRRPGRGAHLHHDPACLARAVRRRAFGRALRVAGVISTEPLEAYVASRSAHRKADSKVGRPT
jgi:uncharacterized protein